MATGGSCQQHDRGSSVQTSGMPRQQRQIRRCIHTRNGVKCVTRRRPRTGFRLLNLDRCKNYLHSIIDGTTAIAAGAALVLTALSIWMSTNTPINIEKPQTATATQAIAHTVNISLDSLQKVDLLFNSPGDLTDARITIQLPQNVELNGFPGEQSVSWVEDIASGSNMLTLELKASSTTDGQLVARIEHQGKTKSLYIRLKVQPTTQIKPPPAGIMASLQGYGTNQEIYL